jgi:hypothetical protein
MNAGEHSCNRELTAERCSLRRFGFGPRGGHAMADLAEWEGGVIPMPSDDVRTAMAVPAGALTCGVGT